MSHELVDTGPGSDARSSPRPRRRPFRRLVLVTAVLVLLLPVPWRLQLDEQPLARAWRLDGRLQVQGELLDPAGSWSWLTAGRPPLLVEVLFDAADGRVESSVDLRSGPRRHRPSAVEPIAATLGLREAGVGVDLGVHVEVHSPTGPRYPEVAVLTHLNGIELTDRAAWVTASNLYRDTVTFRLSDGSRWEHDGRRLPWESVVVSDVVPAQFDAQLWGNLPDLPPIRWARDQLALGPSHGLMVALTTWADATGLDLRDRHVAGTGGLRGDGRVVPIGQLAPKAAAARDAGADILLFPAVQADDLAGFDPGPMELVGVGDLADATRALAERAR